jgi:hypothetical protein
MTPFLPKDSYISHNSDILSKITPHLKGVIHRQNGGLLAFCPNHDDRIYRAVSVGRSGQAHIYLAITVIRVNDAVNYSRRTGYGK